MAVNAKTVETYDNSLIFEDLDNAYRLLSPTECPFQQAVSGGSASSTYKEWPVVALNAVDSANRVAEGDDAPAVDDGTLGKRMGNYSQISDKVVYVSESSMAVDAAADNVQNISTQMALKMKELKRDIETMLLMNVPALPGASNVARQTAGVTAFLTTNTDFSAGGADPTLSGTTEGYPNAAAVAGTATRDLLETDFNDVVQSCWLNGGDPSLVLVNANNKRIISETFTGNATRYKDTTDQKVVNAIDFYDSDFGTLTIVPTRFMLPHDGAAGSHYQILFLDPSYLSILDVDPVQEKPLAETGHSKKRLLWREYLLKVDNEAAHGVLRDLNGVMP